MDYKSCLGDKKEIIKICCNIACKMNACFFKFYLIMYHTHRHTTKGGKNRNNANVGQLIFSICTFMWKRTNVKQKMKMFYCS